ncbi:MAG: type II toxin-antitoxin system VapC family toxin [Kiritimatiellae bacterium]|nr:type II toxin-antitoxin system VapC family toxin [Kiritimatiellia bacterium]
MPKRLILDTCGLVWLVSGDKKISRPTRREIDAASVVYVSAISAWEVSLAVARGQLTLPLPARDWFEKAVESHNLSVAALSVQVLTLANELPWHHRDPADRFIIATAKLEALAVVTADKRFKAYGLEVLC